MNRSHLISHISDHSHKTWDIIVIGGGATGAGIAFDAVSRGYDTLLLEQDDFGKGTSSRSTKLIHGGVRYLAQGDIVLVLEALQERGRILKNAPHIATDQQFIVPVYGVWDALKYTTGLKFYDLLAGRLSLGKSRFISRQETLKCLPNLNGNGLKGGVIYHDGQFDDSRLLISLIQSLNEKGGIGINYCRVTGLIKDESGKISGVSAQDTISDSGYTFRGKVVINATGVFADDILKMDRPVTHRTIRPSQGVHLVFDARFLGNGSSIMIPKTDDGRVLFVIPWYDKVVVGTTDTLVDTISLEPRALDKEIDFILDTTAKYLKVPPERKDILTVFAGLRPLVAHPDDPAATRELSRRHKISISRSGLVSVEGGKWTIYRRMAEDAINKVIRSGMLVKRPCHTSNMPVYGAMDGLSKEDRLHIYGKHMHDIKAMADLSPAYNKTLHPLLPYTRAEIIWIIRNEMPVRIEDVLARRTRALFLDARASREMAPAVAAIMAEEMGYDKEWELQQVREYNELVENYIVKL